MQSQKFVAACIAIALTLPAIAAETTNCNSVSSCLALSPVSKERVLGITKSNMQIAERIASLGPSVLPELLLAMDTDNDYARGIIDFAVGEMEGLSPGDLVLVRKIMLKDPYYIPGKGGWSYRAVARIGTEEAIRFLVAELLAANTASNQQGFALAKLGDKGLPYLIEALKCQQNCDPDKLQGIFEVFREMKDKAGAAAGPLLEIAQDKKQRKQVRLTAIRSLGFVAASVKDVDKSLDALARGNASFTADVRAALVGLKSPLVVDYLTKDLREYEPYQYPDPVWELAALGPAGAAAGPALLRLLRHEDWNTRVNVAYALASIEYRNSIPELIKALTDKSDWKVAYVAIHGISRMKDASALPALREAAASHWYPPVRDAAACAIGYIEKGKSKCGDGIPDFDMLGLEYIGEELAECETAGYPQIDETAEAKQYAEGKELKRFKYRLTGVTLYPDMAAKVADGWLTGRDHGEFGGELMFFPRKGKPYKVMDENIEDIYVLDHGVIAVTGLAHLSFNRGLVYELKQDAGKWQARPILRLPSAPHSSYKVPSDEVLVHTYTGAVILNARGNIKMAVCASSKGEKPDATL